MGVLECDLSVERLRSRQVEQLVLRDIERGIYPLGERLPSVVALAGELGVAAKTIYKVYQELALRGIVEAVSRKGYYVISTQVARQHHIFLLLDNYSTYKQSLFQTMKREFGPESELTVHFHGYDPALFRRCLCENRGKFSTYIVSTFYMEELEELLLLLPPERLYLLGRHPQTLKREYHGVFQDFRQDVVRGLTATGDRMWYYERLVLCFRDSVTRPPSELLRGFSEFCKDRKVEYRVLRDNDRLRIQRAEAYLIIDDNDLIDFVRQCRDKGYTPGEDVGVISYNDSPMKEIIGDTGISVISTDFTAMGESMVEMVQQQRYDHLLNPSYFIDRGSF